MIAVADPFVLGANVVFRRHLHREQAVLDGTPFQVWTQPEQTVWTLFYRQSTAYLLRFPDFADFSVSLDGQEVDCWPCPLTPPDTVSHLYLNQVLPLALSRQGRLVLHGSAVTLNGYSMAFLGRSGKGKSTLAAAFAGAGARFLTDDGLRIEWAGDGLIVLPSHPSIRLWSDSREALIHDPPQVAPPVSYTSKQRFLAGIDLPFCDQPRPLRRLFLLGDRTPTEISIRPCSASEALMGMVSNSFLLDIAEKEMLARHFDELVAITHLHIHFHLDYPRRYEDLPRVRDAIMKNALEGLAV